MREKLILVRNFLYRFFVIGFVFNVLFQLLFMFLGVKGLQEGSRILELRPYYLIELLITLIAYLRVFFVYFVLFPALALHWTIARDKILANQD